MTESNIEVEHGGEIVTVPTTFETDDVETWFSTTAPPYEVDRIFTHDGHVRAWSFEGDEVVEIGYFPNGDPVVDLCGWIADALVGISPDGLIGTDIGETVWERDAE